MSTPAAMHPITETDIANYLVNTPDFFERHAELLATVQLSSPHGQRAVSLQERQADMLRDKIRMLEHRIMDMVRHGHENTHIADKLDRWARALFQVRQDAELPACITRSLREQFDVPQVALQLWGLAPEFAPCDFAQRASDDTRVLASSLTTPYCGENAGFEAVQWLDIPAAAHSLALIPMRDGDAGDSAPAFGLLVLASSDPQRFHRGMGTDFLERLAALASAALARLRA